MHREQKWKVTTFGNTQVSYICTKMACVEVEVQRKLYTVLVSYEIR